MKATPDDQQKRAKGTSLKSLNRALDILETIGREGEIGVAELGRAIDMHPATVHNVLRALTERHYLINTGGRYRLGPALAALTSQWQPLQVLSAAVQPYLEEISSVTGEAASATILVGYEARIVAFQPGTQAITIQFPQWEWPNAMSLATGRLLVSLQPESTWHEFIVRNAGAEPYWSEARWVAELRRLRAQDCSVLRRFGESAQTAIGLPVRSVGGVVVGAIGASAPAFRAKPELCQTMLWTVWDAALELSRELGWEGTAAKLPTVDWGKQ